jgi:hypothetical protein
MNDKKMIVIGLTVFLAVVLFPFWYNRGKAAPPPELQLAGKAKAARECVLPKDVMLSEHMQLLAVWRESVVRGTGRIYTNPEGRQFVMSLSNTCLDCHSNKAEFCDKCHSYASVRPYCWDCHMDKPKENL